MEANHAQPEVPQPAGRPSALARLARLAKGARWALALLPKVPALVARIASLCTLRVKNPYLRKLPAMVAIGGLVVALGWRMANQKPAEVPEKPPVSWLDVRAELEAGNFREARVLAAHLRARDDVPYDEMGAAPYAFGAAALHDADATYEPSLQKRLYLVASRYFEEASVFGFPEEKKAQALADWGRALYAAGKYARSLHVLRQAYELEGEHRRETARLLAGAYFRDEAANLPQAKTVLQEYLADSGLSSDERQAGLLEQARVLIRLNELTEARAALGSLPPQAAAGREAAIIEVWLSLRESADAAMSAAQLNTQVETLRKILAKSAPSSNEARQATYLLGLCYAKLGEEKAAVAQFERLRKVYFDSPEASLAALELGDLHQKNQRYPEAVEAYGEAVRGAAALFAESPMWTSVAEMRQRLVHAYEHLRDADEKESAIALARRLTPLFAADLATQLQVEAEVALAEKWEREAATLPFAKQKQKAAQTRAAWRQAAATYARLAQLRYTTREYPDLLWRGGECCFRGRDYAGCEREMQRFMEEEPRQRRAAALTYVGASQAAQGKTAQALDYLRECLENYRGEPAVFQARLVAAQLHESRGEIEQARGYVRKNLESPDLSPSSLDWRISLLMLGRLWHAEGVLLETRSRGANVDSPDADLAREGLRHLEHSAAAFREGARHLEESVARFPDGPHALEARYLLAESWRGAARFPRKKMQGVAIETLRANLQREMHDLLQKAVLEYDHLERAGAERQERHELSETESKMLRDGYFGHAEALFDLARYEDAIRAYSNATNRYQREPEALEAYLQIAACYRRLNRPQEARGTLEQAKVVLQRLREEAPFLVTSRYDRTDWTQFIDWMGSL